MLVVPPPVALSADDLNAMSHDDKSWVMAPKDYANTRYSGLDQIKVENVGKLQLVWSFSVGADRGQEAAPLIVNNTMFVVGPFRCTPQPGVRIGCHDRRSEVVICSETELGGSRCGVLRCGYARPRL